MPAFHQDPGGYRAGRAASLSLALLVGCAALACGGGDDPPAGDAGGTGPGGSGGRAGSGGGAGRGGSAGANASGGAGGNGGAVGGGGRGGAPAGDAGRGSGGAPAQAGGMGGSVPAAMPIPALPPRRPANMVFHSTNVSMWEIHDVAVYNRYKANFDEIISIIERGYYGIAGRLGTGHKLPLRVIIEKGGCCGAFAGGGDVGYNDGNFMTEGSMNWVRGVVIGEVVNGVTGAVSAEWPRDWWADTAWYFPGFVTVDVLKDVLPAHAVKWETDEKYPTYPVYQLYKGLLGEQGWAVYQKLFALVKEDKMDWSKIGANPSAIKTNYVVAYMSLAAGQNLGARFKAAQVNASDPTVVQAIMDARAKLVTAGAASPGWARFRAGDYQAAAAGP